MATKKIAYVDVNFAITVRVPVDYDDLPEMCNEEGEYLDATVTDEVWNKIVSDACDVMDGPDGSNVESMVVSHIEEQEVEEEENPDDIYNNSPEYIHDAALDWMNDHADFLNDIGQDNFIKRCAEELAKEGYNTEDYYWAVEEAFEDMDWDCPEYDD